VPVGYLIATPIPQRNGWLIEQSVRRCSAPNGTMELLVDAAMTRFAQERYTYLTLGMAPLTQRVTDGTRMPLWLRIVLHWARSHGGRFYNFEGLDSFKAKFKPEEWEPLFVLSQEPQVSPQTLMAILGAFSDGSLYKTATRALTLAVRQELARLREKKPT
jgi:phosphatidylglycerol lysyltransferase